MQTDTAAAKQDFFKRSKLIQRSQTLLWETRQLSVSKRLLDVCVASLLLLILSPVWFSIWLYLQLTEGKPLYRHKRIGAGGETFECIKFRSMVLNGDEILKEHLENSDAARVEWQQTFKLKNDPRIRPFGSFLRKSSLDEIPQLLNVLRGEMTLVGPRPVVKEEIDTYYRGYAERCFMQPPGVTGLWQVCGRNSVDYSTRVALDVLYMRNSSFWLDIKIMFLTGFAVLKRSGQ